MIQLSENKGKKVLVGAYRSDKAHLDWILGTNPFRHEVLYNVRYNEDLFASRCGGFIDNVMPDFVLLYDSQNPMGRGHLFPCKSKLCMTESDMKKMKYPSPQGSYLVYTLGDELESKEIAMTVVLEKIRELYPDFQEAAPAFVNVDDILPAEREQVERNFLTASKQVTRELRFIDLFAGIGGIRCGLEQACRDNGISPVCVFTSEIKPHAVRVLLDNHPTEIITGDITKVRTSDIPDFDVLCAGFPCQAFSSAGKRKGFADTRGTMFFEVERILRDKQPQGFILENVEGLVNHDDGRTLQVITERLHALNYHFTYRVLNSKDFGVPQERKRVYIVGSKNGTPNLENFPISHLTLGMVLEQGCPVESTPFVRNLLAHFKLEDLYGKSIKDKRGGETNIHSWDLEIKGHVTQEEKELLDNMLLQRRKHKWAEEIGIDWMDGMPLTIAQIRTFYQASSLQKMLNKLAKQGYVRYEHPKKLVRHTDANGNVVTSREYDLTKPKGYNIVAGKLSFEINKILSPNEVAPTLVAMDMQKLYVGDNGGLRKLTLREGLRLCGYPDDMLFNVSEKEGFDLIGNTVVVPVIRAVANRLLEHINID